MIGYAIVQNGCIQIDACTNQLEIYETEYDAQLNCPICCDVVEIMIYKSTTSSGNVLEEGHD